jgi:transcription elongation factor GreA
LHTTARSPWLLCFRSWGMALERIPMTREGYEKRKAELDRMQGATMTEITKRVATAREMGDLSENAEYHAAREDQGMLQAKIDLIKDELNRAYILDPSNLPTDQVVFGRRVTVRDLDSGDEEDFVLVGPGQDNAEENKILTTSPIGQGLLGKKKGDVAEIKVPMGMLRFQITAIGLAE